MKACSQSPWASLGRGIHSLTWTEAWALPFILCPHLFSTSSPTSVLPLLPVFFSLRRQRRLKWSQSFQEKDDAKEVLLCPPQIQTHRMANSPSNTPARELAGEKSYPLHSKPSSSQFWLKGEFQCTFISLSKKHQLAWLRLLFLVPRLDHSGLIYFFFLSKCEYLRWES